MNKKRLWGEDNHHIVFMDKQWCNVVLPEGESLILSENKSCITEIGKELREQGSLIVPMNRLDHEELHKETVPMPALGYEAVKAVLIDYTNKVKDPTIHPSKAIEKLQLSIEHIPSKFLSEEERILAEICLESLDIQRPLIAESVNSRTKHIGKNKKNTKTKSSERRNGNRQFVCVGRR